MNSDEALKTLGAYVCCVDNIFSCRKCPLFDEQLDTTQQQYVCSKYLHTENIERALDSLRAIKPQ